jgi:prevent-host-death family protein
MTQLIKEMRNMKKNEIINVNQLQARASQVIKEVAEGKTFEVMRYSEPSAVIIPYKEYELLKGGCRHCVEEIKDLIKNPKS